MADPIDRIVLGFDRALRTLTGHYPTSRASPAADIVESEMDDAERRHVAGLMRVNHCGEICAQALYEGQAVTARSDAARDSLQRAAQEERDHLRWCRDRLGELDASPSVLDPLFYGASFLMGAITGLAGDKVSLGFVEATEDQVVAHLDRHLETIPSDDEKTRAIIRQMRSDEERHGAEALALGGSTFPAVVKSAMTVLSRFMTATTYRV